MILERKNECPCCEGEGMLDEYICHKCEASLARKRLANIKKTTVTVVERSKVLLGPKNKLQWAPLDLSSFQYQFNPKKPPPKKGSFVTIRYGYAETDKNGDLYVLF